jgi:hypothetical protein
VDDGREVGEGETPRVGSGVADGREVVEGEAAGVRLDVG